MIAVLLLALPTPAVLAAPAPAPPQETKADQEAKKKKEEERAFPKLGGADQQKAGEWLYELRKSKKLATAEEARGSLIALGAGVVPAALDAWAKFDQERLPFLVAVLDRCLVDADLDLAWKEVGRKTAPAARCYLVRRLADSEREDALELLAARYAEAAEADPGAREAYEAARGLAWRRDERGLPALLAAAGQDWGENRDRLRRDFAGLERGPLSVATAALVRAAKGRDDRLAALRLFELLGARTQLGAVKPVLRDPDNVIKLAAINACQAIHGEDPVDTASVMQIIELSRSWEERI